MMRIKSCVLPPLHARITTLERVCVAKRAKLLEEEAEQLEAKAKQLENKAMDTTEASVDDTPCK